MSPGPGPRATVTGPPATAPRISLLTQAEIVNEPEERWGNGIAYEGETCGAGTGRVGVCTDDEKALGDRPGDVEADAFVVYATKECSPMSARDADEYQAVARRRLEAFLPSQVEEELWMGTVTGATGHQRLADTESDDLNTDALEPHEALACIEDALGSCGSGGRGMIHATRRVVTLWVERGLLIREAGRLMTYLETLVVPGGGYPGTSPADPDGPAEDTLHYAYGTGMVQVRLGPPQVIPENIAQATDRAVNNVAFRAERAVVVSFEPCCHVAAGISVPPCGIGGAS